MAGWTKGPKCSVHNCPSRLWTLVDGRRVCKNGHVDDSAQLVDDEEDVRGHKSMRQATETLAVEHEEKATLRSGLEHDRHMAKLYGCLLRDFVNILTSRYDLPVQFESIARNLFLKYLNCTTLVPQNQKGLNAEAFDVVWILRLAMAEIRAPVYWVDFIQLIRQDVLPLRQPYAANLPNTKLQLKARNMPIFIDIPMYHTFTHKLNEFAFKSGYKYPEFIPNPLIYKLVRDLMLPPAVYSFALNLFQQVFATKPFPQLERYCIGCVCVAVKAMYLGETPNVAKMDSPDWDTWADMILKVWVYDGDVEYLDAKDAIYWDKSTMDKVLSAYQRTTLPIAKETFDKRLYNMFPIPEVASDANEQEDPYDLDLHKELMVALYTTMTDQDKTEPFDFQEYTIYHKDVRCTWVLPPVIEALYRTCSRMYQIKDKAFRDSQAKCEELTLRYLKHKVANERNIRRIKQEST